MGALGCNPSYFESRFGFGLVAGQLYLTTRSLWNVVGLHTGWNFIALAFNDSDWRTGCLINLTGLRDHSEILANIIVLALAYAIIAKAKRPILAKAVT